MDPNAPKKNQSAFFMYSEKNHPILRAENPEAKFGDIAKMLSSQFRNLSEEESAKWLKLAVGDRERYQREMKEYKERFGWDLMVDSFF